MTVQLSKTTYAASAPRQATYVAYINGIEVPTKSVSLRYGVWQVPEMQVEMVADPVITRLGSEDRVQVAVFYLDDCDVDPSVQPAFRVFGEGEITGWGYRNTSSGRSIVFTVVSQIAIYTQLFVQFMTTLDDMVAHATHPGDVSGFANASSQLVYPFALFNEGLLPGQGQAPARIKRPYDFLYNTVKGMMASVVPASTRTVPAANFFTRWARLTNFHNRFAASPFFDEVLDNPNIFPVLGALQSTSAVEVIVKDLLPNLQNAGSIWDMLQLVFGTMLMEIAMIPGMPLVSVDLPSSLVQTTDFTEHKLIFSLTAAGHQAWTPALPDDSRKKTPKRMQNFFPKPQMLFSVPPTCNVIFPSQMLTIAYDENYATQPTRLYFNDEVLSTVLKIPRTGVGQAIPNALSIAWPLEADALSRARDANPLLNGKNFLLYPEEFYKGPVMDRRVIPPWLFFLKNAENQAASATGAGATAQSVSDNPSSASTTPSPARTGTPSPPRPSARPPVGTMATSSNNGKIGPDDLRVYLQMTEQLRPRVEAATRGTRVPSEFVLVWINMESGGNRYATDGDHAKGIFQILPEECTTLRSPNFPHGVRPQDLVNDPKNVVAIQSGIDYILVGRAVADHIAREQGLAWTEADMWRLTKLAKHNLPAYARTALAQARSSLGRPPKDWSEFYNAVVGDAAPGSQQRRALDNATATGVLLGASGTMTSASDPAPFTAGAPTAAPAAPAAAATRDDPPETVPPSPALTPEASAAVAAIAEDTYHLYAKFEFFRERYAKRSGSANITWNPYVVPGFPGVLFDQRASRVDLMVYVTTVQQMMSNEGKRSTTLSFMYGRQLQEMFDLMANEFSRNDATARGSAPQEPVRDISKVTQSFVQAETYYQRLFYGAQQLFGKDAAFDFRKVVAMAPVVAGGAPEAIFVDGPDTATQDANVAAAQTVAALTPTREATKATLLDVQARVVAAQKIIATTPTNTPTPADTQPFFFEDVSTNAQDARATAQVDLVGLLAQEGTLRAQLTSLDARIRDALSIVQGTATTGFTRVEHNLDVAVTRELVPTASAQAMFDSRDAAMRYNWRPICTLDEYVVFYDSAGEGAIPAFGHPRSVGARFFERIRTFSAPAEGFVPPPGVDGLGATASVPGLSATDFPQTRTNWDQALLAYRNNVLNVKAPRT